MDPDPSSFAFLLFQLKSWQPELFFPILLLGIMLLCSALVSGSEVAFFSLRSQDLEPLRQNKKDIHDRLADLLERPKTLLATILISNNFINVGIVILSAFITNKVFEFGDNEVLQFLVKVVGITFLILLFGEVLPKVYAAKNPVDFAGWLSRPMLVLRTVFRPLSRVMVHSTGFLEKSLSRKTENLSVDDLSQALEITSHERTNDDEQKILQGIVKFGNTNVKQIMKPRLDVVCVDQEWDYHEVLDSILESGFSRIPVYEETFDNVQGILYVKDLIPHMEKSADFEWNALIRQPFFVPENKKIDDLLKEFQSRKVHMAVVADEYGGTSGIITLEDVIEEIVGEISDEFDQDELVYSKLDEHNYVFEGKIHLTDFIRVVGADEEDFEEFSGDADSLAGFLLEVGEKFPEKDEELSFAGFTFKVESIEGRRIKRIKVTIHQNSDADLD